MIRVNITVNLESRRWGALWLPGSLFLFYGGIKSIYNLSLYPLSLSLSRALFPALITYFDPGRLCLHSLHKCPYFLRTLRPGWRLDGGLTRALPWTSAPRYTWWSRAEAVRRFWVGSPLRDGRAEAPA